MGIRSVLAKPFAAFIASQTRKWSREPHKFQHKIFDDLIKTGGATRFGKDHNFSAIRNYEDFKGRVPVRDYEELKVYIDEVIKGKPDVLWKGTPAYLAKRRAQRPVRNTFPLQRTRFPIISTGREMHCSAMFMKPVAPLFWTGA